MISISSLANLSIFTTRFAHFPKKKYCSTTPLRNKFSECTLGSVLKGFMESALIARTNSSVDSTFWL